MIKSVNFVFLLFISQALFGQVDVNDPLGKVTFDDRLIKQYGIRSVTVFADMNEDGIDGNSTICGKVMEFEFDKNGFPSYRLTAGNGGNGYFLYYDKGSRPEYFSYDSNGTLLYHSEEDFRRMTQIIHTTDSAGNIVQTEFIFKNENQESRFIEEFEWKDGVRIGCTNVTGEETIEASIYALDGEGRIIESKNAYSRLTYEYTQSGDTLKTKHVVYRNNELSSVYVYHTLPRLDNRCTYYSYSDHTGTKDFEMTASYDEHGNAIRYSSLDYSESERGMSLVNQTKLRIVNTYDYRGLLTKRSIYSERSDNSDESLVEVNYFIYDTEELIFQIEKGSISRISLEREELRDY